MAQYATARLIEQHIAILSEGLFQLLIHAMPSTLEKCHPNGAASAMVHDVRNGAAEQGAETCATWC
jgi:hypothetical protein